MAKKAKASKGAKGGGKKAGGGEPLLVVSKVKAALRSHDVNVASDAADALNMVCYWYIEQAAKRAMSNGRKTVRAHDFIVG
jgi:histone H3/H4